MNSLKLEVLGTGGNCEAYFAVLPNGWQIAITDDGDPSLPDLSSTHIAVGIYKDDLWTEENQVALERVKLERPKRIKDQAHLKVICEAIAFKVAWKHYQFTVPCGLCGIKTHMLATERCDGCWELETRIKMNPKLARKILEAM